MTSLKGKTVFITGASSGIGRATAIAFAREGARLLLCARRLDPLEELRQTLATSGAPAVHVFELDVQKRGEVETAIANLPGGLERYRRSG